MSDWQPMDAYPIKDGRDENGKWFPGPPGPIAELKMKNGRIVIAQWRGEPNVKGGTTYAFWRDGDRSGIGHYDPIAWRPASAATPL